MPKIVNTALKAKAKAWTFEAKAAGPEAKAKAKNMASRPRPGLEDYITEKDCNFTKAIYNNIQLGIENIELTVDTR